MKTPPKDSRGQHTRVYNVVMDSPAWKALSMGERGLYLELRRHLTSFNNGDISATMTVLRHAGINSPTTLAKGLRALLAGGFLAVTREGGVALGQKVCTLYRFTDEPCFDNKRLGTKAQKATMEFRQFTSTGHAKAAISASREPTPLSEERRASRKAESRQVGPTETVVAPIQKL